MNISLESLEDVTTKQILSDLFAEAQRIFPASVFHLTGLNPTTYIQIQRETPFSSERKIYFDFFPQEQKLQVSLTSKEDRKERLQAFLLKERIALKWGLPRELNNGLLGDLFRKTSMNLIKKIEEIHEQDSTVLLLETSIQLLEQLQNIDSLTFRSERKGNSFTCLWRDIPFLLQYHFEETGVFFEFYFQENPFFNETSITSFSLKYGELSSLKPKVLSAIKGSKLTSLFQPFTQRDFSFVTFLKTRLLYHVSLHFKNGPAFDDFLLVIRLYLQKHFQLSEAELEKLYLNSPFSNNSSKFQLGEWVLSRNFPSTPHKSLKILYYQEQNGFIEISQSDKTQLQADPFCYLYFFEPL